MPTISDIAQAARVSKATVSNVFTNNKKVSCCLRQRVLKASEDLNYHPNHVASSLATKKTNIIGLLLGSDYDGSKKFFGELISGVTIAAGEAGYRVLLDICGAGKEKTHKNLISRSDPFDGSIILAPVLEDIRIKDMLSHSTPFVIVGRPGDDNPDVMCVDVDNENLVFGTVLHLIEMGHKRIGFLNSGKDMTISFDRLKGYVDAMIKNRIDVDTSLICNIEEAKKPDLNFFINYIRQKRDLSAIITSSDEIAFMVYKALEHESIKVPEDMSVVALGGEDYIDRLVPRVTTVAIDYAAMGRKAVEMLVKTFNNIPVEQKKVIFETRVLKGGSCAPFCSGR
jgi:DNA-binding LacI/PurR family transcriptional regulator